MQELRAIPSEALMFRTPDDLVLKVLSQVIEIITVARHANNQILIFFWIFLRIQKRLSVNDIKLDMVTVHNEIRTDEGRHIGKTRSFDTCTP